MPAAAFKVRLWMPRLVRRFAEEGVLTGSLALAALGYFAFPIFHEPLVPALLSFMVSWDWTVAGRSPSRFLIIFRHRDASVKRSGCV